MTPAPVPSMQMSINAEGWSSKFPQTLASYRFRTHPDQNGMADRCHGHQERCRQAKNKKGRGETVCTVRALATVVDQSGGFVMSSEARCRGVREELVIQAARRNMSKRSPEGVLKSDQARRANVIKRQKSGVDGSR